jgi:electron transfer flavoprotein alpha subunit
VILVFVEHDRGEVDPVSLETVTFARRLVMPVEAVLIGEIGAPLVEQLHAYGVSAVHSVEHPRLGDYAPEAWAESVVQLIASAKPQAAIAPGNDRGNEVMAHVAARMNLPMAANCTDVEPNESQYSLTRVRWGGSLLEDAQLGGAVKLLTMAEHAVSPEESAAAGEARIEPFTPVLSDDELRVQVSARVEPEAGRVSLPTARLVVGGGRGVGSAEAFATLDELAELLGGAVGCSRAVTGLGWRPHSDQIGQTGTRIAPDLYIACGISGAVQHMVGCKGAKRILVINTDPNAPVLARADYAVIGDVNEVVPALNAELRKGSPGG